jgi:hypothetical protein
MVTIVAMINDYSILRVSKIVNVLITTLTVSNNTFKTLIRLLNKIANLLLISLPLRELCL